MNISHPNVTYSSIVKIGEDVNQLEKNSGTKILKLHRGVMDVTTIEIDHLLDFSFDTKELQHYTGNDGYPALIKTINEKYKLNETKTIITPGGMAGLDLIINSLSDDTIYVSKYHWGSWNKILKIHGKTTLTFDEFSLKDFRPISGIVMLCLPSNPTGYQPELSDIKDFLFYAEGVDITVILDLPYYHLFNSTDDTLDKLITDNVILVSSFSKSIGLSGYRVGFVSTKSKELYETLRIRSLYKYNSISVLPQVIIEKLLTEEKSIQTYKKITVDHIQKNIEFLAEKNLLMDKYPSAPIGPFAIIKLDFKELLAKNISSVPLSKFTLDASDEHLSRISVAVNHEEFVKFLS